jgi:hypothetical protein
MVRKSTQNPLILPICFVILTILLAACGPKTDEKCGDGVCDETEQKNPDLCPEDCYTPGNMGETGSGEAGGGSSWFGSATWSCYMDRSGGGFDQWVAEMEIELSVDLEGNVTGSGFGEFVNSDCEVINCSCSWDMSPISLTITGQMEPNGSNDPDHRLSEIANG